MNYKQAIDVTYGTGMGEKLFDCEEIPRHDRPSRFQKMSDDQQKLVDQMVEYTKSTDLEVPKPFQDILKKHRTRNRSYIDRMVEWRLPKHCEWLAMPSTEWDGNKPSRCATISHDEATYTRMTRKMASARIHNNVRGMIESLCPHWRDKLQDQSQLGNLLRGLII